VWCVSVCFLGRRVALRHESPEMGKLPTGPRSTSGTEPGLLASQRA
jgi:hypothetical protein